MNQDESLPSSYHVLAPMENGLYANMTHQGSQVLVNRVMAILNDRLDDAQQHKDMFNQSAMQPLVFDVLREIKQKNGRDDLDWLSWNLSKCKDRFLRSTGLNMRQISNDEESYQQDLVRLDTMLLAERIIDRYPNDAAVNHNSTSNAIEIEHPEYEEKLNRIRHFYHSELARFDKNSNDFCTHVVTLLQEQSKVRPITSEEISHMISMVRKKLCFIQIQLKQNTCEAVMNLRTRFLDAR